MELNRPLTSALVIVTACLAGAAPDFSPTSGTDRPHIILVMADDQGWGDTGYNGHPFVQTPTLDAMAKEGFVFNRFYAAAPVCSPTRASVLTGRNPNRSKVTHHGRYIRGHKEKPLPRALQAAGYVTGMFGKWHVGSAQPDSPVNPGGLGFDEWVIGLNFFDNSPYLSRKGVVEHHEGEKGSVVVIDETIAFLEKHKDGGKPMFAVAWFPSPHDPHAEVSSRPELYEGKKGRGYFQEITLLDEQLGRLRKWLRDAGIADDTLLWYCSDNGGLMKESSGGRGKKGDTWEGGLRVPGIIEWPGRKLSGSTNVPVVTSDIYPTLMALTGIEDADPLPLDGVDVRGVIEGKEQERPGIGFWLGIQKGQSTWSDRILKEVMEKQQAGGPKPAIPERMKKDIDEFPQFQEGFSKGNAAWLEWPWKVHRRNAKEYLLFNLEDDPLETTDLAADPAHQERFNMLKSAMQGWQKSVIGSLNGEDYEPAPERPNVIFIMSDDHSYQAMGSYGSRFAKLDPTPNLDRFARSGVVFDQVFCSNSICTPSRASVMTGQYSHRNGVRDLYDTLPGDRCELSREMQRAGYQTAVVGKWHLKDSPKFFDYFAVIAGQGKYMNPTLHVSEGGEMRRVNFDSTLKRDIEVIDTEGHSSDVLTDTTLAWLRKRERSKPFFLMHHFKAPHDMFVYAPRYERYLEDAEIPEPGNLYDQPGPNFGSIATRGVDDSLVGVIGSTVSPQTTKRNLARHYRGKIRKLTGKLELSNREMTHHTYQLYLKEYLRCVKGIDDNLQRLLDYLEKEGLMENTLIVYTSDQGMMLGEHDYIDKRWMLEESIRLPLIVHWPEAVKGSRCDWLLNNTDFAPTMLAAAGVPVPGSMQGRNFLGALNGEAEPADWRRSTYYRYWMHMAHGHNNPAHFGIRNKNHKLIFYYGTDWTDVHAGQVVEKRGGNRFWKDTPAAWEFYDLKRDPFEMHNRYRDPEFAEVIASMKAELRALRKELGDTDEHNPRIRKIIDVHWND